MFSKTTAGVKMDLWNLDPKIVTIEHIANALARINRYAGHWVYPISVARHCLVLADGLKSQGFGVGVQLQGLLHDAPEAYTLDIPSPLKDLLTIKLPREEFRKSVKISYRAFEDDLTERIFKQLGVMWPLNHAVIVADHAAYGKEATAIRGQLRPLHTNDPEVVAILFIGRAKDLMDKCGIPYA